MSLTTRLTSALNLQHPIVSAPMAFAAGGKLAAAVSGCGGLGLIGGGYGDADWLATQFQLTNNQPVGVGFITWALKMPVLQAALEHQPGAVMLSFGDPAPFAAQIHRHNALLICQCQNLSHVQQAIDAGANIIVAQGTEAGGHGASRSTMTLVPECADYLSTHSPATLLLAAGGIADGRGLAASLLLGADGVLVGTRLWASREALVSPNHHQVVVNDTGDNTIRTSVADIARKINWPDGFSARIRRNEFTDQWHGREAELLQQTDVQSPRYQQAFASGDTDRAGVWFGEAAGLINSIDSAAQLVQSMSSDAKNLLRQHS